MCLEGCEKITRRNFLANAAAAALLANESSAQKKNAVGKSAIVESPVSFANGADRIDGFLARPAAKGKYPAVLILHGNAGLPADVRYAANRLAAAGFIGLAVSSTSRERDDAAKLAREFVASDRFIKRYLADAEAALEFLKSRPDGAPAKLGVLGFCGGGYAAARFAAIDERVRAVVALYASPEFPPERNSPTDPRPPLLEFIDEIKIPVQYHYGTRDHLIPLASAERLAAKLKNSETNGEYYLYKDADHGFASFGGANYHARHAATAEKRWLKFFRKHL
jgi:carboxymethylenebutenolidase